MPRLRTPGPGAYDPPAFLTIEGSMGGRPTASFASCSKRDSKRADSLGDPGLYDVEKTSVHLGVKEPISAKSHRSFNKSVNDGKGSFNSSSQRDKGKQADGSAKGGPGSYDSSHLFSCGADSVAVTSSFMSSQPLGGHVRRAETPGVGVYNPENPNHMKRSPSKEGVGSSMFAGTTRNRSASTKTTSGEHVGPGTYETDANSLQKKLEKMLNPRAPGFGSSSYRDQAKNTRAMSPSPGAYEVDRGETVGDRTHRTFNTTAKSGRSAFGSNSKRDKKMADSLGDPGLYDVEKTSVHLGVKEPIAAKSHRSFNKSVNSGKGSFNSSSQRDKGKQPDGSAKGGPGAYDSSHLFSCGASSVAVTSSFMSSQPLGGHVRRAETPGVGVYNPENPNHMKRSPSKEGVGSSMFAGTTRNRSAVTKTTSGEHVGPGTYETDANSLQKKLEKMINPRAPGFGSSSTRDKED